MKYAVRAVLLAFLATLTFSPARADGPVSIGVNGVGVLSRDANIGWIRSGSYWKDINPAPGVWNFDIADSNVGDAESRGQQMLFILSGAPAWCGGGSNGNSPCDIESWKSFVDQVSRRYAGRVAAYEIWNEPDLTNQAAFGVGWNRDVNTYPRYVDYLAEASRIIRRNAPGTLVVGPVMSGSDSRAVAIWQQLDQTWFPDGNASDFLDVVSFHHNTHREDDHSEDMAWDIHDRIKWIIRYYNPRNGWKPMWITEFGWKVGTGISEATQRVRTKNLLIQMGGGGSGILKGKGFNIQRAFIYRLFGCDGDKNWGIYGCDFYNNPYPRPVVYNYLHTLTFPAIQDPSVPVE